MTRPNVPDPLLDRLRQGHRFLITSHVSPDGDAVGSSLGLTRVLRRLGKSGQVWLHDEVPALYRVLPGADRVHVGEEPPKGFPEHFDAVVVLECPSLDRSGIEDALKESGLPLLNVDHHLGNQLYGQVNWTDTASPSLGIMIHRIAQALHVDVDAATGDCLYLTVVTDTGGFRFSNATAEAFDAAADLVRDGASPDQVAQWLYESKPEASLRLLGEVLGTLEMHHDGRVACVWQKREMVERSGARPGDSEGLIDYPRSIAGVEAVALFRELEDGGFKVSLRSRGSASVERVARSRGGGGHHNAAGFTAEDRDADALHDDVVQALSDEVDRAETERREQEAEKATSAELRKGEAALPADEAEAVQTDETVEA